jgi:peroxiredoxin
MKNKPLVVLAILLLSLSAQRGFAAEKSNPAAAELRDLLVKITPKLEAGTNTEKDLTDDFKEFDALLAKHKGEKTDDVAEILVMKARVYLEVFDDTDKGAEIIKQVQRDFPQTTQGQNAYKILEGIKKQEAKKKIQSTLLAGTKFPDFDEKDTQGKPLSLANYKGKVVLLDFWATWSVPSVRELPNVLKTYEKYHANGFEVIGINMDADRQTFSGFVKEKNMTWQQFFDGQVWKNRLAVKYGVHRMPATFLLNGEGIIIGKDLRGEDLEKAVAKALAKN